MVRCVTLKDAFWEVRPHNGLASARTNPCGPVGPKADNILLVRWGVTLPFQAPQTSTTHTPDHVPSPLHQTISLHFLLLPKISSSLSTQNSLSLNNNQHSHYPLLSQSACSLSSLIEVSRRCTSAPPSFSTIIDPDQPEHSGADRPKSVCLLPPAVVTVASQDILTLLSPASLLLRRRRCNTPRYATQSRGEEDGTHNS